MTDNEIIKALECCSVGEEGNCGDCPLINDFSPCGVTLTANALDLIKRQQAEIERLETKVRELKIEMSYMINPNTIGSRQEMGCW